MGQGCFVQFSFFEISFNCKSFVEIGFGQIGMV